MKLALFAFNGDPMCFVHVLLHALDLRARGHQVHVVIEGTATALVRDLHEDPSKPFAGLYEKVRAAGLVACVCEACAAKTGAKDSALAQGLELCGEMSGHPSIGRYLEEGFQVLTF